MITDATSIGLLLKALGYGVPAAFLVFGLLLANIFVKYQQSKSDKDRKEHMTKWESMIQVQRDAIQVQDKSTQALIQNHKDEINRMFISQERQAQTLESLAHSVSLITAKLEQSTICPNIKKV